MKYETYNEQETFKIASCFAKSLKAGSIIALSGELGAGKTAFVKGLASALGYKGSVSSPTFTLVNEYQGDEFMIYHFDVYRLLNIDLDTCDWIDEYLFSDGISIIEWAENLIDILPDDHIKIHITKDISKGEDFREIEIC